MSAGRPGGLTALAVMNFIFGGWVVINMLGILVAVVVYHSASGDTKAEFDKATAMVREMSMEVIIATLCLNSLAALLEILAGFGYVKQKRILGRWFGNAFALLAIAGSVTLAVASQGVEGMGFTLGALLGVLYPLITLILINTTFREDLVN